MKNLFKNTKRIIAGVMACAIMIIGMTAFAENSKLAINDVPVENAEVFKTDSGVIYVPVRKICEALNMEVLWDGENEIITLVKLPVYITFSPNGDGYTFAKTAPMLLGNAPILKNDTTYVPVNFIDEILQAEYEISEDGKINIKYDVDNSVIVEVVVGEDLDENQIMVFDAEKNSEVVLNITEETVIVDENGAKVEADKIVEGMFVRVEYSEAMTMSIPPMTNAISIEFVKGEEAKGAEMTVVEAIDENGRIIVVNADKMEIALNITETTEILDKDGNKITADKLVKDTLVEVEHEERMTRSIPPMTNAISIKVK